MKQGLNLAMPVVIEYSRFDDISTIEFVFKQTSSKSADVLKRSIYKSDGTGDAFRESSQSNRVIIPWTASETYLFKEDSSFFMDTRITLANSNENPITPIVKLSMNRTLFNDGE